MTTLRLFHGTNQQFARFDQNKSRIVNDLFGGGVAYFTDDRQVAFTYAKSMSRKSGAPVIYEVELRADKIFDVNHVYTGKELQGFVTPKNSEAFARGAGMLPPGTDKYSVMIKLEAGDVSITGTKLFLGLSRGMNATAAVRKLLISKGYDTLRYNGGLVMDAKKHNVYIGYDADKISIKKRWVWDPNQKSMVVQKN